MGNPATGLESDTLNVRSIRKNKRRVKAQGNNTMKGLSSQMDIPPGGLNLRDKYRNQQEESDDEFSLVDIEEAIHDAA